mgnify:CR=1 FL=1
MTQDRADNAHSGPGGAVRRRAVPEARATPRMSLAFGFGAMAPLALAALAAIALDGPVARAAVDLAALWGGALLAFLAGVRRGLSFRTPDGPRASEIAAMLWLFALGVGALAAPDAVLASALLFIGFASLAAIDPIAARRGAAPPFFARLRPVQMAIAVASFAAILATRT